MCRSRDFDGFQPRNPNTLIKMKSFFVRLSGLKFLPDSLTLVYLPRIIGAELFVDGSKVGHDSPTFLALHRMVSVKKKEEEEEGEGEAVFGSRKQVWASGGVQFEVYMGEEKVLEGSFRKEEDWKLECECGRGADVADVCVAVEGDVALFGRVEMVSKMKRRTRRGRGRLEVIPEVREEDDDDESLGEDVGEGCGTDCSVVEMDLEGVRWAVDVGIWVMCLGVGYLVSKASARSLRKLRLL